MILELDLVANLESSEMICMVIDLIVNTKVI